MKKIILPLAFFGAIQLVIGQSFQEICANSNTNGVLVDFQYYQDTLYATGFFNTICGESAGYIAKWENDGWEPAAISISDPGHALKQINGKLYIAKYVESVDSNWVYVYDNTGLEKLGAGVYLTTASGFSELPNIYDIVEYDGKIVACGEFDRVGSTSIQGIMQWNGNNWEGLGSGLNGNIPATAPVLFPHQMLVHNDELYVIGNFREAGGLQVNGVAKWNGSEWSALGDGFNGTVYSITVFNDEIIAGGSFTQSGGNPINRIAKWDGTNWLPLDFGFTPRTNNDFIFVHTLSVIEDILYLAGGLKEITYADNSTEVCNGIVSYDGNTLNVFNGGVPGNDIEAIAKIENGQLLIGGGVFGSGYMGISAINTSVREANWSKAVQVFPNPFQQAISINSTLPFENYEITNSMGKLMQRGKYDTDIALTLLPGIYFIRLLGKDKTYAIHKIVKQ